MKQGNDKLSFFEKAGYGFGDLASVLFWQTITAYLLFYYTDVFGLTAAAAGTMIAVSRILDAVFDVGIGITADRTQTRWGKFRPYLLWMALPLALSAVLSFTSPDLSTSGKLLYAYITFIMFMFFYSAINIPYSSLLGVISSDPIERTSAASFKFMGAYIAGFIVSATALPMAAYFGRGNDAAGWQMTMICYSVAATVFFLITFLSTRERIQPIAKEKTSIKEDMKDISKNSPWIILFAVTILFILFVCIRISVTTHYFKYYVGTQTVSLFGYSKVFSFEWLASAFNAIGQILSIVGVIIVPWFARTFGKKQAVIYLFITALLCTFAFYFFRPQDVIWMFAFQIVGSLVGGPISTLLWSMYADTADYSEWKNNRRATGLVYSASIMSTKIGWAIGAVIAGSLLSYYGFAANLVQNADVLGGLKSMMSIIPTATGILALALLYFYRLDDKKMNDIKIDLEARREAIEENNNK